MKRKIKIHILFALSFIMILFSTCNKKDDFKYKNPSLTINERVDDLLMRMTLEEKFWQLYMIPGDLSLKTEKYPHGIFGFQMSTQGKSDNQAEQLLDYSSGGTAKQTAELINKTQKFFIEETRLGIPIIAFDEALHGLVRKEATAFPQAIALAATWDTSLMADVAYAIAMESKSRGIRQILSPVLNIARDVRWGRTEETYGEDPFLTSQMAFSFINQFEKNGVITTPKHFIANVGDGGRDSYPIHFNERLLEEIYFPAFKTCFQKANAWSVMTSYNSLDGRPCTSNDWLLNQKLKNEWGFQGFVISDAGATGGANVLHYTAADYAESTKQSIESGLDVIFQTSYDHFPLFYEAFEKGLIDNQAIDEAVKRVLYAKYKLGLFENPYVNAEEVSKWNGIQKHREIAKEAAGKSIVLLKNHQETLPLKKEITSIALIGSEAENARLGGYSGPGNKTVSILQGLKAKVGESCDINFVPTAHINDDELSVIPSEYLFTNDNGKKIKGLKGEYFNNINLEGDPDLIRIDSQIDFRWTLFSPDPNKINYDWYSVKWTGKLLSPETGEFNIGMKGDDGYRLYINDKLIIDNWKKQSNQSLVKKYSFIEGQEYDINIEFYENFGNARLQLVWNMQDNKQWKDEIHKAISAAKKSDAIIIAVGIEEGEFQDRASLALPGHQEELILELAKLSKPVIVVLVGGSAITMNNWMNETDAILDIWYPGDEGGNALADILFGDVNPSGKLPITFPQHEGQLPLYYNHKPTGRGDDYINMTGKPLFPFGFGLSYSKFEYSNIQLEKEIIASNESTIVHFEMSNTSEYDGEEVVQLYIKDMLASVARPILELKGYQRVHLKSGETKKLYFKIEPELLSMLDIDMNRIVEPGDFRIMIAASSNDIRLRKILKVK